MCRSLVVRRCSFTTAGERENYLIVAEEAIEAGKHRR